MRLPGTFTAEGDNEDRERDNEREEEARRKVQERFEWTVLEAEK